MLLETPARQRVPRMPASAHTPVPVQRDAIARNPDEFSIHRLTASSGHGAKHRAMWRASGEGILAICAEAALRAFDFDDVRRGSFGPPYLRSPIETFPQDMPLRSRLEGRRQGKSPHKNRPA